MMPPCQLSYWKYSTSSVQCFATPSYHSDGPWSTLGPEAFGEEDALKQLYVWCWMYMGSYIVAIQEGAISASSAWQALPDVFVRRPPICKIFKDKADTEHLTLLPKYFRSELFCTVSLKWSETFHVYTKPDTPSGKESSTFQSKVKYQKIIHLEPQRKFRRVTEQISLKALMI